MQTTKHPKVLQKTSQHLNARFVAYRSFGGKIPRWFENQRPKLPPEPKRPKLHILPILWILPDGQRADSGRAGGQRADSGRTHAPPRNFESSFSADRRPRTPKCRSATPHNSGVPNLIVKELGRYLSPF